MKTKRGISDAYRLGPVPEVTLVLRRATVFDVFDIARILRGDVPSLGPAMLRDHIASGAAFWVVQCGAQVLAVGRIDGAGACVWGAADHAARLRAHLEAELTKH